VQLTQVRRFPVKSMLGEVLTAADVTGRGLAGDREWAVRDPDGKFGSGKNTRRFRRMPGLFDFRATADLAAADLPAAGSDAARSPAAGSAAAGSAAVGSAAVGSPAVDGGLVGRLHRAPVVELADGRRFAADDPAGHRAVSEMLGRPVTLTREADIPHHDEGPVSLITTASLHTLTGLCGPGPDGAGVDPLRFRANLLLDTAGDQPHGRGFPEDDWAGRRLRVGDTVVLRVVRPITRCVMIDMAQERAVARNDLLKALTTHHAMTFGVLATVETPGRITAGDTCRWA
jgi:uncharacterized protein YcbX